MKEAFKLVVPCSLAAFFLSASVVALKNNFVLNDRLNAMKFEHIAILDKIQEDIVKLKMVCENSTKIPPSGIAARNYLEPGSLASLTDLMVRANQCYQDVSMELIILNYEKIKDNCEKTSANYEKTSAKYKEARLKLLESLEIISQMTRERLQTPPSEKTEPKITP